MYYLESGSTDPAYNLALEQYVFDTLSQSGEYFMLWQNRDSVIIGVHQNTAEEIDIGYAERNDIEVVRRLSGGGAVFHDLGNLNFTFITHDENPAEFDLTQLCKPIAEALLELGLSISQNGRNDITIGGRKFSGNAAYYRDGRLMRHGTLLFDTDINKMNAVLNVPEYKLDYKRIKSVRGRVTNLREHMIRDMTIAEFWEHLRRSVAVGQRMTEYTLSEQDRQSILQIRTERYTSRGWNYGFSPVCNIRKSRTLHGFGTINIDMEVNDGYITTFSTSGDYFGNALCNDVAYALINVRLERDALLEVLSKLPLDNYYKGLSTESFIQMILE